MRLLFISSFYLFPETRFGGSKRLYYFAREWSRRTELSVICMDACREWTLGAAAPSEFKDFLMVPGAEFPDYAERLVRTTADRRTFIASYDAQICGFMEGKRFDAIVLAFPWALTYLHSYLADTDVPILYIEDDLLFEQFRMESIAQWNPIKKFWKWYRFRQTVSYYRPLMARISRFIGISAQEIDVMKTYFPDLESSIIQYGIPMEEYPMLPIKETGRVIGFLGNFAHPPNLDALTWLLRTLAPAIRARCPEVTFLVAGKGIPEWAKGEASARDWIEIRENPPDLRGFYSDIHLLINPIRTGRGMRTKLIEAAAFGRPILTTSLGGEGLESLNLTLADNAETLVEACARFWDDSGTTSALIRNRETVVERFSLEKISGEFLSLISTHTEKGD
ncbi:MAG: glycosyltransferase family 4 protein [Fibrobacteria bacterium]